MGLRFWGFLIIAAFAFRGVAASPAVRFLRMRSRSAARAAYALSFGTVSAGFASNQAARLGAFRAKPSLWTERRRI